MDRMADSLINQTKINQTKHNRRFFQFGYVVAFFTLLSLFLLSKATEGSEKFEQLYQILLISIVVGIACLFVIVIAVLWRTFRQYRLAVPGASLSLSILGRTLFLALIPLLCLSFFSFKFLRYEFQSSFDKGINDALNNALLLSQKALDVRASQALQESRQVATIIAPYEYKELQRNLESIRQTINAEELTVFDEKGFIQAFASLDRNLIIPMIPDHSDFTRVENGHGVFVVESDDKGFRIRVLTDIDKPGAPNYYLQTLFYIPDTVSELTNQVNATIKERDRFNYLMPKVSNSFIFVLILVLLLACLLLILSSIGFANHMVQPIRDLIRGTKNVSQGDFEQQVLIKRQDDFGTLIRSFNQMTQSLKTATEEAEMNRHKVESERAYLATVINHMTSAVLTLDFKGRLLTFNERAEQLLDCPLDEAVFCEQQSLSLALENYKNFISQLPIAHDNAGGEETEIDIQHNAKTKRFVARLTALPSTDALHGGYVIIFDEFGQYLQRQKQAAWEEVARRLAHEIKNPLTPILLAAERLNYKLSGHLPEKEQQVLTRSIDVISNQVKSLKNMVDDFSDYAKPIAAKKTTLSLHTLLQDIFDLYKGHFHGIDCHLLLQAEHDNVKGNANLLRQVLHNLLKNAIEACEQHDKGIITLQTVNRHKDIIITISDNGVGLPDSLSGDDDIFEPYVTTKEKGTGLGLAIVKKIIREHRGKITLNNRDDGNGSVAEITLPLTEITD